MWELNCKESWAPKNWCFWTVVLEKTFESSWTARRSNQSILKEISPGCPLEGLMLKLKLQYFGHLMWRADSLERTLMLGKIEGRRRRGWHRMRWLDSIDSTDMGLGGLQELVMPSNWPSHPLSSPSPPALNLSQHQGIFKWVSSLHQVAKVLEF